jgi:predicted glycogen debranching enzyme
MLRFGREITGDFGLASRREWLVTNGLGSWSSGTVGGANTRRYHGLFVPSLQPPLGRTVLVAKLNERATLAGQVFPLSSNEYGGGTIDPHGYKNIESFQLDWGVPTWTYALAGGLLEKRVWMPHGHDAVFVTYTLRRAARPLELDVLVMTTSRDAHVETQGGWLPQVELAQGGALVHPPEVGLRVLGSSGDFVPVGQWHWNVHHRVEQARGLPAREDHYALGRFLTTVPPGETWTLVATTEPEVDWDWQASLWAEQGRARGLVQAAGLQTQPAWVQQLVLAADQFLVRRGQGQTVIAGYHWFGDWGRDTMIALPGLALTTRRYDLAADVLRTFSRFVSQGMLPNRFPDSGQPPEGEHAEGEQPEYNTVDATLWYFHAIDRYLVATGDHELARELLPVLDDIVDWHMRGTRYNILVDPGDGLLFCGQPGVQLTWMDAKVGDWVVTPRIGKPVEINALWINALRVLDRLHVELGVAAPRPFGQLADRATASFERFWHDAGQYLYDVIDGPDGSDASLRPNQLLAVSLPNAPISGQRARAIVEACAQSLLTSYGLRSLSPNHPAYIGAYGGDQKQRDAAYHQGTVWGWLIGPFVDAYLKAYGRDSAALAATRARSTLAPFEQHLADAGLGSISEIFDGDAPFVPAGCIAQAWSVAEVLRAWVETGNVRRKPARRQSLTS